MPAKGFANLVLACAITGCLNAGHAYSVGNLHRSDVMTHSAAFTSARGEWFEPYIASNRTRILPIDRGRDRHRGEIDVPIPSDSYKILARLANPVDRPDYIAVRFVLSNRADEIVPRNLVCESHQPATADGDIPAAPGLPELLKHIGFCRRLGVVSTTPAPSSAARDSARRYLATNVGEIFRLVAPILRIEYTPGVNAAERVRERVGSFMQVMGFVPIPATLSIGLIDAGTQVTRGSASLALGRLATKARFSPTGTASILALGRRRYG